MNADLFGDFLLYPEYSERKHSIFVRGVNAMGQKSKIEALYISIDHAQSFSICCGIPQHDLSNKISK